MNTISLSPEKSAIGQASIECRGFHFPKAVLRTLKKRIEKWLALRFEPPPSFHLRLEREGSGRLCLCALELNDGSRWFRTSQYADDTQAALSRCLEQMMDMVTSCTPPLLPEHPIPHLRKGHTTHAREKPGGDRDSGFHPCPRKGQLNYDKRTQRKRNLLSLPVLALFARVFADITRKTITLSGWSHNPGY